MRQSKRAGLSKHVAYITALTAFGIGAGVGWGQNQAIVPADVAGQASPAPSGATPGTAAQGGASGAPATQAVVPAQGGTAPAAVTLPASTPSIPNAVPDAATTPAPPGSPATNVGGGPLEPPPASATNVPAVPEQPLTKATPRDGNGYPVTEIDIGYKFPHPNLPPISDILNSQVRLGIVEDGYVAARPGVQVVSVRLGDVGKEPGPKKIYRSGIAAIYGHILRYLNDRNIIGVFVVVDPEDIKTGPPGETADVDRDVDNRKDRTSLQLVVVTSTVKDVRTVEIGDISSPNRVNDPRYDNIRAHSPLQPAFEGETERRDLLRKDELDDYRLRLNRVQGRRVDVAISGTNAAGEVYLDYLIANARPWYVYAQISNTGTDETALWRERFGVVDTQLTNHDDMLSLEYITSGFSSSQSLLGAYEFPVSFPFLDIDRLRNRAYGSWSEFTASDVGQSAESFTGSGWTGGDELIYNFYQRRELFVDAVLGARIQETESQNTTTVDAGSGKAIFYVPYFGLRLERVTDVASTTGQVLINGYFTTASVTEVTGLGRTNPSMQPWVMQLEFTQTMFLEPLIDPQRFASGGSTLAHELSLSVKGQYSFDNRLFPQAQDVAGGLYTVRGYPESIVAADSQITAQLEYRYHIPRAFAVMDDPSKSPVAPWDKTFRFAPQQPYGRPDWDLIFRAFVDAGQTYNVQAQQNHESNATLLGTGIGLELLIKQNFNVRVDLGVPLTAIKGQGTGAPNEVNPGDYRFHISSTFLY